MNFKKVGYLFSMSFFLIPFYSYSNYNNNSFLLEKSLKKLVSKEFKNATVYLKNPIHWIKGGPDCFMKTYPKKNLSLLSIDPKGFIRFSFSGKDDSCFAEGWCGYEAWLSAKVATKRLRTGDPLTPQNVGLEDVNVAQGNIFPYRNLILLAQENISIMEATQTFVEGQYLLTSGVRKIPDIRKGDSVEIKLISKNLVLTVAGIAQESSYLKQKVKVLALKTKKELLGVFTSNGLVEVNL